LCCGDSWDARKRKNSGTAYMYDKKTMMASMGRMIARKAVVAPPGVVIFSINARSVRATAEI
jgi:hypothetical protein